MTETELPRLQYVFQEFFLGDKEFVPLIRRGPALEVDTCNAVVIAIDSLDGSDLEWKVERETAARCVEKGLLILWEFDFGFHLPTFDIMDLVSFNKISLVLEHFSKGLLEEFKQHTLGVSLYSGGVGFFSHLLRNAVGEKNFREWLVDLYGQVDLFNADVYQKYSHFEEVDLDELAKDSHGLFLIRKFSSQVFGEYLQRLVSFLPDTLAVFAFFDLKEALSTVEPALFFLRNRFHHLFLGFKNAPFPLGSLSCQDDGLIKGVSQVSNGLLISEESLLKRDSLQDLEKILSLSINKMQVKPVSEALFTEEWDGLDHVFYFTKKLSSQGKRKLMGFEAAGGIPVYLDEPCGVDSEIPVPSIVN